MTKGFVELAKNEDAQKTTPSLNEQGLKAEPSGWMMRRTKGKIGDLGTTAGTAAIGRNRSHKRAVTRS